MLIFHLLKSENIIIDINCVGCTEMWGVMRMPVFRFWEILGILKEIIPTAPFEIDLQLSFADIFRNFVPLFRTGHR
jgi:hypothetical protein